MAKAARWSPESTSGLGGPLFDGPKTARLDVLNNPLNRSLLGVLCEVVRSDEEARARIMAEDARLAAADWCRRFNEGAIR